jgi:hypothetical protein
MIVFGAIMSGYILVASVVWAIVAYQFGKHYGEKHDGQLSAECAHDACSYPALFVCLASTFWPLFFVFLTFQWWHSFWNTAGMNATLPPENSHPTAKPPDVEFVE